MKPIHTFIPDSFESARLTIRVPREGDGAELNRAVLDSHAELKPWMPWAQSLPTLEESETRVCTARAEFILREDIQLLLFHRECGELVGSSGLHRIDWAVPRFEIGYWVRTKYRGQGFITEATHRIAAFAFQELGAARVEIRCDSKNRLSAAVPERLTFPLEATLKNEARSVDGQLRDTLVFAATSLAQLKAVERTPLNRKR